MGKKKSPTPTPGRRAKQPPAACIIPNLLYLGPVSAASNTTFLAREGITHVLSIGKSPASRIEGIIYERLGLTDAEDSDIGPVVTNACDIIDGAERSGGKVLVHCSAAISRSPTVVAAYLMRRRGVTLRESLVRLVEGREAVAPNRGFLRQLCEMERELFGGDGTVRLDCVIASGGVRVASWL
ncbi:protein-tyrosine phosphatase-like protein [Cercophora scortea]|uniref:protein-tyrosine-phosphatase n=1 Tax=Cercophora scortea TaxID=314031 RepID=A0AAE0IAH2_9PEZI|nr:protein-tyrosine phosphatase-like protein [Cercophora scortea]